MANISRWHVCGLEFLDHINNLSPSIQFTMEKECNNTLPFFDTLFIKRDSALITSLYETHSHWIISLFTVGSPVTCETRNCSVYITGFVLPRTKRFCNTSTESKARFMVKWLPRTLWWHYHKQILKEKLSSH
jgi:hypothetical protein